MKYVKIIDVKREIQGASICATAIFLQVTVS